MKRILLPRLDDKQLAQVTFLLKAIGALTHAEVTVLQVLPGNPGDNRSGEPIDEHIVQEAGKLRLVSRLVESASVEEGVLIEASRGYDLIIANGTLPATAPSPVPSLFLLTADCTKPDSVFPLRKILVPVSGTKQSLACAELAFAIAKSQHSSVFILHFDDVPNNSATLALQAIVLNLASQFEIEPVLLFRSQTDFSSCLAEVIRAETPDLMVVAARRRVGDDNLIPANVRQSFTLSAVRPAMLVLKDVF